MCKAAVTDLRFKVHDLPSAQVGHGKKILQDIHEGKNDLGVVFYIHQNTVLIVLYILC